MVDSTYSFKEIMQGIYSLIDVDDWDELPGTNNPVESINRQSTPTNVKSVSLKPLLEHFYLEDCKQHCKLQLRQELQFHIGPRNREEHVVLQKHWKADWLLYPLVKNLLDLGSP